MRISIKSAEEIAIMAKAGKMLADVMREVKAAARLGVSLNALDALAARLIREAGCKPAFLGYRPDESAKSYPASICASVNDIVVHGIPDKYLLKDGDVLKLDFGLIYPFVNGFNVDAAVTVIIGFGSDIAKRLVLVTEQALSKGIAQAKVGNRLGDIGHAIQKYIEDDGFSVVEGLTGHGIGRELHEDPPVFNYGKPGTGILLQPGMVIAIEPMVSVGKGEVIRRKDDSFSTKDGSLSAHFEHTVAVTSKGPRVLTK